MSVLRIRISFWPTNRTRRGALPRVYHVLFVPWFIRFLTLGLCFVCLVDVHETMGLQVGALAEPFSATRSRANVRFVAGVDSHVRFQVEIEGELLSAAGPRAFEWAFAGVWERGLGFFEKMRFLSIF